MGISTTVNRFLEGKGTIYRGGPPEGFLQKFSVPARIIAAFMFIVASAFLLNWPVLLTFAATVLLTGAVSLPNYFKLVTTSVVPALWYGVPVIGFYWLFHLDEPIPWLKLLRVPFRIFVCTLITLTTTHSIGLKGLVKWLGQRFGHKTEDFAGTFLGQLISLGRMARDMIFAYKARTASPAARKDERKSVGRQGATVMAYALQQGREQETSRASRLIDTDRARSGQTPRWRFRDYALVGTVLTMVVIGKVFSDQ